MGTVKITNDTIHTTKAFIYKKEANKILFLLIKEPEGVYGFVGGAQEENDNTFEKTIKREIREEVGLTSLSYQLKELQRTVRFIHEDPKSPRFGKKGVLHIFTAQYNGSEQIHLADDLLLLEWASQQEVLKKIEDSYAMLREAFNLVCIEDL